MSILLFLFVLLIPPAKLIVVSPDFRNNEQIPRRFTCEGENINPSLIIHGIPQGTKSLAVVAEDPDAPDASCTQWLIWDIPPADMIVENTGAGTAGVNSTGKEHYRGPCEAAGHRMFVFKVYALDTVLNLKVGAGRLEFDQAVTDHILAEGEIKGRLLVDAAMPKSRQLRKKGRLNDGAG